VVDVQPLQVLFEQVVADQAFVVSEWNRPSKADPLQRLSWASAYFSAEVRHAEVEVVLTLASQVGVETSSAYSHCSGECRVTPAYLGQPACHANMVLETDLEIGCDTIPYASCPKAAQLCALRNRPMVLWDPRSRGGRVRSVVEHRR
jgi:hypothetical protein